MIKSDSLSYNRSFQYLQWYKTDTGISSLWNVVPASATIAPQRSDLFSAGYSYSPDGFFS
ncbi:hypothetical protein CS542_00925 [Pedobacter sp. IW39]|nr:hypothetical protein CS542_00925 [Pedobacter sp. IW39]